MNCDVNSEPFITFMTQLIYCTFDILISKK